MSSQGPFPPDEPPAWTPPSGANPGGFPGAGSPYGGMPQQATGPGGPGQVPVSVCYRHPDRRAGVTCQRCNRPICPSCMTQGSVGFHCPECVKANPAKAIRARDLRTRPVVTMVLIGLNVAMFIVTIATAKDPARAMGVFGNPDSDLVDTLLMVGRGRYNDGSVAGVAGGEYWRLLTGGFLHAGALHLAMNMFALWVLGNLLEPALGRARFLAIYVTALFAGSLGVVLVSPFDPTVGASGAIFGLMGAAFVYLWSRGVNVWQTNLPQVIGINLMFTFLFSGISKGGHIGGLVGGAVVMFLVAKLEERKPNLAAALGVAATLTVVVVVAAILVSGSLAPPPRIR